MDATYPQMSQTSSLGKIAIAPEVIEMLTGLAAGEIEGVVHMNGGFVGGIVEKLGRKNIGKGVKVEIGENHAVIDVSIIVNYGVSIPRVASDLQDHVKNTVQNLTGLDVLEVNVHVIGVEVDREQSIKAEEKNREN